MTAFRQALIAAAHKDLGVKKTLVRKAVFIICKDKNNVVEMQCAPPLMREDIVRVGQGGTDLRYRPEFEEWKCQLTFELDVELFQVNDLLNLINRGGFGVGICEWRPEKGGELGRFQVDEDVQVEIESKD